MTLRTTQSSQSRDDAIVQCLRIFARQGRKIRMQKMSLEKEFTSESKDAAAELETTTDCTNDDL